MGVLGEKAVSSNFLPKGKFHFIRQIELIPCRFRVEEEG